MGPSRAGACYAAPEDDQTEVRLRRSQGAACGNRTHDLRITRAAHTTPYPRYLRLRFCSARSMRRQLPGWTPVRVTTRVMTTCPTSRPARTRLKNMLDVNLLRRPLTTSPRLPTSDPRPPATERCDRPSRPARAPAGP